MNQKQRASALNLAKKLMPQEEFEKLSSLPINDLGFGFDMFGLEKESAVLAFAFARYLYKYWFRVESHGHENIPESGPVLIVPNHSGVIPLDAAMVAVDLAMKLKKPRITRAVVDNFMGYLPFISTFFYRVGQVVGARRNFDDLLRCGEMVAVFPEGTRGTGKLFSQRYKLQRFPVGFIEMSLDHRAPIVPTAVIGSEEQAPMLGDIKPLARLFKFPYVPITPTFPWLGPLGLIPLPVKYHVRYGEPFKFYEEYPPETTQDPEKIRFLADKVRLAIQEMVNKGLEERKSVFGFDLGLGKEPRPKRVRK